VPASGKLTANIAPHAAFLVVAGLLSMQGCGGPVSASPAMTAPITARPTEYVTAASKIDAGRYLVKVGGCNDCHTPGYAEQLMMSGTEMPESDWLMGADVGFAGAWGVSYPANLRLSVQNMTEEEFVAMSRAGEGRPPMPWPSLMAMSDSDLKAIYAYIRFLGPKGAPVPAALSPGVEPDRPYMLFEALMPKNPAKK
jgi:mono/diheme cytochrome c family protein